MKGEYFSIEVERYVYGIKLIKVNQRDLFGSVVTIMAVIIKTVKRK